ncbi:MAG: right-handed parallel beta-helix repeat-containing protein [Phaeodactylibacter sp.]|nr:right-handed parallel beta-helix repeat-containing protein [Phaeodactylibacter sp.]
MATTYYVDSQGGNDGYDGLAPAHQGGTAGPWKSLSKVNFTTTFSPGDSILFKRGGTWFDGPLEPVNGGEPGGVITITETVLGQPFSFQLVNPDNNNCIYFGAYGVGAKPVIDCQGGRGIILWHNYIIVEDLHLDNGDNNVLWLARAGGNYWCTIRNVDVTNSAANAVRSSYGGGNLWLKGLYVYNYGVNGILLNGSENNKLKGVLVEDCWVENPQTLELEDAITCHQDEFGNDLEGDIIIRNNTILRSGEDGIDVTSGHNILLEGNDIRHSYAGGIYVVKPWVHTIEIRGNFIFSNSISQGVGDLTIKVPNVWAVNNIIAGTGHHCLHLGNTDNTKIWNNVIAPEGRTGNLIWLLDSIGQLEFKNNIFDFSGTGQDISGDITPNITFDYNCYYGVSPSQDIFGGNSFEEERSANPLVEPNGFWADPQFDGPGRSEADHFKLPGSSPCIDQGATVPLSVDFWGVPRPQGVRPDIGVYEHGTTDCNPDPNIASFPGSACDDGDPTTINDIYSSDCLCAGQPGPCTGIGDNDGDGICADADCDDNDATIAYQPGDACNDGDPLTANDIIQSDCTCAGDYSSPVTICSRINSSSDDAEERASGTVNTANNDLELTDDTDQGIQTVGMRFNGLNIPQGATIVDAYVQFTTDETDNANPCRLAIYGQASDNAPTFQNNDFDISGRPKTTASISWEPQDWLATNGAGEAEKTPDISAIIQELVDRNGYAPGHSVAILIEGIGRRTAKAFDGSPPQAPELCVKFYHPSPDYGCPALNANIGDACNDGDNTTVNDVIGADCNCAGTPTACTGFGDNDGDGICANLDCNDNNPNITTQPGDACNDGDNTTLNDAIDSDCNCTGTPTACTGFGDNDGDGACAHLDCDDNDPNVTTQPGDSCDDGDNTTVNDTIDANCNCTGTPTACNGLGDNDADGVCANLDCDDNNPNVTTQPGDPCDDGDNTTLNDAIDANCNCTGTSTACAGIGDSDGDGVCDDVDCNYNNPNVTTQPGDACDDGDNTTLNDAIDNDCNCTGIPTACTGVGDSDGDGACANLDCDDNNPDITAQPGDACDDGDPDTTGDTIQGDCSCSGEAGPFVQAYSRIENKNMMSSPPADEQASFSSGGPISPIAVYPNPANSRLVLSFSSAAEGRVRILAVNVNGTTVLAEEQELYTGNNQIVLESLSLPDGLYFLRLFAGNSAQAVRFIISNQ